MEKWRLLDSKRIVTDRWIGIRRDECLTTRGVRIDCYHVIEKPDFVMVVPVTAQGELLLVRQYKHPSGEVVVECPAGYIEPGEAPADAAARELREETGHRAGIMRPLGVWFTSPAVLTNHCHIYLCTGAELEGEPHLDATEDIEIVRVHFEEALRQIDHGGLISDVASVAAIALAARVLAKDA